MELDREHRLTTMEVQADHSRQRSDRLNTRVEKVEAKLTLHERVILVILGVLQILLQDKYPALAALIKGLIP